MTHTGRIRLHNEDAFLVRPEIGLWAVADGMGGHMAGDVASQMIIEALNGITAPTSLSHFVHQVENSLQAVNRRLLKAAAELGQESIIGSTIVTLLVYEDVATLLWAGDSRLYRYRDDQLQQLSTDHSQVQTYIAQGLISRDAATFHPHSNMITRAVGADDQLTLDIEICKLQTGDRFLLCTDGLTRYLSPDDIAQHLSTGSAAESCTALIDETLTYQAADNITAIVVDVQ